MINVVIDENIKRLVQYGIDNKLIPECRKNLFYKYVVRSFW